MLGTHSNVIHDIRPCAVVIRSYRNDIIVLVGGEFNRLRLYAGTCGRSPVISNIKMSMVKQGAPQRKQLLRALVCCRDHEAIDPRDKVYVLVGLPREQFEFDVAALNVNYSRPAGGVYTHVAIEILRMGQDLNMLKQVAHTANCAVSPMYPSLVSR